MVAKCFIYSEKKHYKRPKLLKLDYYVPPRKNLRNEAVRHFLSNYIRRQLRASLLRLSCCNFSCEKKTKKSSSKPIEVLLVIIILLLLLKKLCYVTKVIQ